jgi:1-acyl-sn-glycerol-3-phosphate acyltransferase
LPLIVLMLLSGLLIAKSIIPWSAAPGSPRYRRVRKGCVMIWCGAVCRILNIKIEHRGRPDFEAGLWVSNHISWIDILALASEQDLIFIAKHEISTWPLMGAIFEGIGTLFIRRGDGEATLKMSQTMQSHLNSGVALMLFPEATTTDGSEVRRFGNKLLQPAIESQTRLQPLALRYEGESKAIAPFIGEDTFIEHLLRVITLKEIQLIISYGPSVHSENLTKEELARNLRGRVIGLMDPLQTSDSSELLQNRHNPFTSLSH